MERLKQNWWLNFLIYFSGINFCFAQVFISQQNVIGLDSALTCSPRLAKNLLAYKFIMMGEMHGTEEPVRYLQSLAMQLAKTKKVKVGFEIPADKMPQRRDFANEQELRSTPFFANNDYGMTSKAWFDAIFQLANTDNVSVFFFDWNEQQKIDSERDSSMFLNIKQEYLKDTTCIILTISGNIHNQIRPYENSKTMGYFVTTYLNNSVLSVNHIYESGTMYNNNGSGAGLRRVDKEHKTIKSISRMPNFFYFDLQHEFSKQWNAFLFTTKINASYPVKNK